MNKHQGISNHYLDSTLHWRHNEHDGVSNHQPHGCLLNHLFRRRSKKTSKFRVTGLCVGISPGPGQRDSYAENVSIWWRHHDLRCTVAWIPPLNNLTEIRFYAPTRVHKMESNQDLRLSLRLNYQSWISVEHAIEYGRDLLYIVLFCFITMVSGFTWYFVVSRTYRYISRLFRWKARMMI